MNQSLIDNLRRQIDGPRDGALLRFALGNALLDAGDATGATEALRAALGFDPAYSAAWKQLGKALTAAGEREAAMDAWRQGIAVAEQRGDKQAQKEMQVFLRRLLSA